MELKQSNSDGRLNPLFLLIVPYGIETEFRNRRFYTNGLLIVPYGIETQEPSRQYP